MATAYRILELLSRNNGKPSYRVGLDLGCGNGLSTKLMKQFVQYGVYAIDGKECFTKGCYPNIVFIKKDILTMEKIPLEDKSIDVILMCTSFHKMAHCIPALLKEINRVLVSGGHFYIIEKNPYYKHDNDDVNPDEKTNIRDIKNLNYVKRDEKSVTKYNKNDKKIEDNETEINVIDDTTNAFISLLEACNDTKLFNNGTIRIEASSFDTNIKSLKTPFGDSPSIWAVVSFP